ncbi:MAG TPA: 50S ribosomal protein L29 [Candidatus Nanoarchaeia archaeon]|nr:50S ribosomal protein L29 [Candidatus Nanoarchaeia archaeon]
MKAKELKAMSELDLESKSIELKKELMKVNSQIAIGTLPKSPGKVKEMKRTIAKILTIRRIKQQGGIKKE